jgi:catecholate siderophore receptor
LSVSSNSVRVVGTPQSFLALSCVGFIASAAPAYAQPVPAPPEEADAVEFKGMTVTDTAINDEAYKVDRASSPKFTAPLLDTPRSVVVVPKQVIKDTGSATLVDALRTVPGITFGAAEGGNPIGDRPFIRGFDSQGSTYLDGVRDIGAQSREVFAVEQIEIVRGSDSTLGGRGSAGGTLNIVSKTPQEGTFVSGAGSYGLDDYKRVTADVNYQLNDLVGVRINGMWHDQDVAGRDELFQKRWGIAPSVTIGLGGPTKLTAMYYHLHTSELPDSGFPYATVTSASVNNAPAGFSYSEPTVGNFTTAAGRTGRISPDTFYGLTNRDFRKTDVDQGTLRAEHDFGGVTLRNTSRYSRTEQSYIFTQPDDSQANVTGIPAGNRNVGTLPSGLFNDYTAGGRVWRRANTRFGTTESVINQTDLSGTFDTAGIKHSFAVGSELAWERAERGAYVVNTGTNNGTTGLRCGTAPGLAPYNCTDLFNPNPNDPWVNYAAGSTTAATPIVRGAETTTTITKGNTRGAYAFDSITLADALIVNLGLRYDRFESKVELPVLNGLRPQVSKVNELWNYQVGAIFKPTANTSLYASYATSATPPNSLVGEGQEGNGLGTVSATVSQDLAQAAANALKVEKTKSYEIGAKADLFSGALSLTLAAFRTETNNARVTSDANTIAFVGERLIKGVEFGFNGNITPEWNVFGGYTYLDSKIVDGGFTAFTLPAGGGVAARTVLQPSVNTGRQFPQTAKHSATLWTNYNFTPAFSLGGGAFYTSRVFGGYADNRYVSGTGAAAVVVPATSVIARSVPSYVRLDATAAYKINANLDLRVNVQNLTDKRYFLQAYSSHYAIIAPGRTAFATLSFRY